MKRMRSVLLVFVLLVMGAAALFAGGNKEVPQIPPVTSGTQYLSPNGDGVQDEASLSFSVRIYVKSKEGYVPEYGLEIKDSSGEVLRRIVETEKRDIGFFAALFSGYKEFTLERTVKWDGLDESGKPFPDGTYNLSLWVVDANGNRQESSLDDFIIDTEPSYAKPVAPDSLLFSPNGDGNRDTITITHVEASEEKEWTAAMMNASGGKVKTWSWEAVPGDVTWDGTDDSGAAAPAGVYRYVLNATDLAGNDSGEIAIEGIELSRLETPLAVLLDPAAISPDGDGVQDSMTVYFDREIKEGVTGWSWNIYNESGEKIIGDEGEGEPPLEVVYDGTDTRGEVLAEGVYTVVHTLTYENGNRPQVRDSFVVDLTPPEIDLVIEDPVFSPDGDGRRDKARARFTSNEKVTWEGALLDEDGEEIFSTDSDRTTTLVVWDGRLADGSRAPEGEYVILAGFTDLAGNTTYKGPAAFKLDVSPVSLAMEASRAFSPNGDGKSDLMPVTFDASQYEDVERWNLRIVDESGTTVQEYGGAGTLPRHFAWDGTVSARDDFGAAPEGRYRAVARVDYLKGVSLEESTGSFLLDTTPPAVDLAVTSSPFAETEEGVEGEVFITVEARDNDGIAGWSMELLDEKGEVLRVYDGEGDPSGDITWNQKENVVAPELEAYRFSLRLSVADEGGNITVFTRPVPLDMLLVKKDGRYYLSVPNVIFGAYRHELSSAGAEMLERNRQTLDRVAGIYERYPSYDLLLEGHALNIYRGTGREEREERILQPLTERRAAVVRDALVERGLEREKIETEAFGGRFPNADVADQSLWWKVRRVEFVMVPPAEE